MTTYNYRCSIKRRCGARKTLKKMIEFYVRQPRCPGCGGHTLKLDLSVGEQTQRRVCYCNGINWPHRKGTYLNEGEFCEHAKVDLDFTGSRVTEMKPDESCPF